MRQRTLTLKETLEEGIKILQNAHIEEAALDAWYLLEYVAEITRAEYYAHPDRVLSVEQGMQYKSLLEQRAERIPLQHITGEQEFMGLTFKVNPHVLIPRQDTETLVELALNKLRPGMKVLDMCTGSGCIIISLCKLAGGCCCAGADISEEALATAGENGRIHEADVEWIQSDLFEDVSGCYDLIVSNPPYIRTAVIEDLQKEVKCHDPYIALDGKEDGLYFYREIIAQSTAHLHRGGWLLFEIGHDQGTDVSEMMEQAGFGEVMIKKDLAGLDRVVMGMYNV